MHGLRNSPAYRHFGSSIELEAKSQAAFKGRDAASNVPGRAPLLSHLPGRSLQANREVYRCSIYVMLTGERRGEVDRLSPPDAICGLISHLYIYIYMYIDVSLSLYIYIYTHIHIYMYIHICIYIFKCVYTYMHTHTHVYISRMSSRQVERHAAAMLVEIHGYDARREPGAG